MSNEPSIPREVVTELCKRLGYDPAEVTQIVINPQEVIVKRDAHVPVVVEVADA